MLLGNRVAPLPTWSPIPRKTAAQDTQSKQPTFSPRWLTGNRSKRPAIDETTGQEPFAAGSRIATHST